MNHGLANFIEAKDEVKRNRKNTLVSESSVSFVDVELGDPHA